MEGKVQTPSLSLAETVKLGSPVGLHPRLSVLVCLHWGPRTCISSKSPGDAEDADPKAYRIQGVLCYAHFSLPNSGSLHPSHKESRWHL